jgi:hypothetical protein
MISCVRRAAASLRLRFVIQTIGNIASFSTSGGASIPAKIRASLAIVDSRSNVDGVNVRLRIDELASQLSRDDLWQTDASRAQEISREHGRLQQSVAERDAIDRETTAAEELLELATAEGDDAIIAESKATLEACLKRANRLELEALMDRKFDYCDCFIEVAAGAGGLDAVDWAQMLLRMYRGWGARNSLDVSDFGPNRIRLSGPVRITTSTSPTNMQPPSALYIDLFSSHLCTFHALIAVCLWSHSNRCGRASSGSIVALHTKLQTPHAIRRRVCLADCQRECPVVRRLRVSGRRSAR